MCSLPRSVRQICLATSAVHVLLLCRTVFDKVSSLVREAGTVGEAPLAENQFTRMLILSSKEVYAILLNQLNSFFPCATTEFREAVAINPENGIVSLLFLQRVLRILDQTYLEEKVTKSVKKKKCSSRCS